MQPSEYFTTGYFLPLSAQACAGYALLFALPMGVFLFLLIFSSGRRGFTRILGRILLLTAALALVCLAIVSGLKRQGAAPFGNSPLPAPGLMDQDSNTLSTTGPSMPPSSNVSTVLSGRGLASIR